MITLVVLGKYKDIFSSFRESAEKYLGNIPKILVRDGHDIPDPPGWIVIQGPQKFGMARNANLGLRAAPHDVLYCGDDIQFTQPDTLKILCELAYRDPDIGILSPRIRGGANNLLQRQPPDRDISYAARNVCFPCVYLKRAVFHAIGYLDERFVEYGYDDDLFCRKAVKAGFKLAVTPRVTVIHESMSTFTRNHGGDVWPVWEQMERNRQLYEQACRELGL
jgi:GT2 family glycosyltransferase